MTAREQAEAGDHAAAVTTWRADRDRRLRDPDGWLGLVGLHWLRPGQNRIGSDPSLEIVLAGPGVPALAGTLALSGGAVRLEPGSAELRLDGAPAFPAALADDIGGAPTVLGLGSLRMHLIRRGERVGLRVRDHEAPALRAFSGMDHFATDPDWRVTARFEPAGSDEQIEIMDVTGRASPEPTPGRVTFDREGRSWTLHALEGGDDGSLWLLFGDATNGHETYGGGRFLYTAQPTGGSVVVDFNLAYNPPCVFSPFATCPLPPPQNRLALRIEAGERDYRTGGLHLDR